MSANTDRRTLLGAGALMAGAATVVASRASAQDGGGGGWQAAREEQDDWLDKPGTRHRMIFDTVLTEAVPDAVLYAGNYINVNKAAYGVTADQLSVVVVLRHFSTVYGFTDAVWAKYGKILGDFLKLDGDVSTNAMLRKGDDGSAPAMSKLVDDGVQYAICAAATHFMAGMIAKQAGEDEKAVEEFLHANAIPGGRFVPAGVVAIDRAQQRGYSFSYVQG